MKVVNDLIEMGFNLKVNNGNIKMEFKGSTSPPTPEILKPLLEELKLHKEEAIKYIKSIVIFEAYEGAAFDSQVQDILNKNIQWLRLDVYRISRKMVLVGTVINNLFAFGTLQSASIDSNEFKDCPWVNERMAVNE